VCGIAGIISQHPETRIKQMLEAVEHRGRDDEGVWTSGPIDHTNRRVCLGHRRLAIIDTSPAGHEPMLSREGSNGRYVLTFNGEIYNYRELREQLRALGHPFHT
jgi:asparagine synthase (glutamine-hydrolysing)